MISTFLSDNNVDALLVTSATNRRRLTGFSAEDHAPDALSGVVLATAASVILFTSGTNAPWARAEVREGVTIRTLDEAWPADIAQAIEELGVTRIGFEDLTTTVAAFNHLRATVAPVVELIALGPALDLTRSVKSESELALIERALRVTDSAFNAVMKRINAGQSERQVADMVETELKGAGSQGLAFDIIVASGPNAAKPHHSPGDRTISEGEPVIIDMGGKAEGYCGDLTRTVWFGQPSSQLVTMYEHVALAQEEALGSVQPGMTGRELDAVARSVFERNGVANLFIHGLGHGVGLRIHEAPRVGPTSTDVLAAGQVVTIEPGLYDPAWGGVRIEDVIEITAQGCRQLTTAPKFHVRMHD